MSKKAKSTKDIRVELLLHQWTQTKIPTKRERIEKKLIRIEKRHPEIFKNDVFHPYLSFLQGISQEQNKDLQQQLIRFSAGRLNDLYRTLEVFHKALKGEKWESKFPEFAAGYISSKGSIFSKKRDTYRITELLLESIRKIRHLEERIQLLESDSKNFPEE